MTECICYLNVILTFTVIAFHHEVITLGFIINTICLTPFDCLNSHFIPSSGSSSPLIDELILMIAGQELVTVHNNIIPTWSSN